MNIFKNTLITFMLISSGLMGVESSSQQTCWSNDEVYLEYAQENVDDTGPDGIHEAIKRLEMLAENGSVWALNHLGDLYFFGIDVEQDYWRSFEYYQLVAEKGFPGCEWGLGKFYLLGIVVEQDIEKAKNIFVASAQTGNAMAAYALLYMFIDEDPHTALFWSIVCDCLLGNTKEDLEYHDKVFQIILDLSKRMNGQDVILMQLEASKFLSENNL